MEITIINDKKNPLLKRREINFKINHDTGTPKRNDVKIKLVAMLSAKPELVIIERMRSEFGKRETLGYVKVYQSEKHLKGIERPHIIERNAPKVVEGVVKEEGKKAPEEVKAKEEEVGKRKEEAEAPKKGVTKIEKPEKAKASEEDKSGKEKKAKGKAEKVKEGAKSKKVKEGTKKPKEESQGGKT